MKDSKKYSEKLGKALRALKRKYGKVEMPDYGLSAEPLVFGVLSEFMTEPAANSALKKLAAHFADWNELRVSRDEEVVDVLGKDSPLNRQVAEALTQTLFAIFNKYDVVNLESLEETGKRQAKTVLDKILTDKFVINYVLLTAFDGHAIPLTPVMIEYLKANDLVHPESTFEEIDSFLERQVPASQSYESYIMLRRESESNNKKVVVESREKAAKKQ
jgi:hypothetical protein